MQPATKTLRKSGQIICWLVWIVAAILILPVLGNKPYGKVTNIETEHTQPFGDRHSIDQPKLAVFIHGAGGGGWEWNTWVPIFEKAGYTCIAKDLEPSPKGIAATKFADYVAQVDKWARPEHPSRVVLVGASMGGILALRAAMDVQPTALVLVNSVGPAGWNQPKTKRYPPVIRWSKGEYQETVDSMPDSDEITRIFAFHHWRDESGAVLKEIAEGIEVTPPKCPLLVVLGDKDTDVPNTVGERMALEYGGATLTFKDMSHVGPLLGTKSTDVATAVLGWLDGKLR